MTEIRGKSILVRVSARFELARVPESKGSTVRNLTLSCVNQEKMMRQRGTRPIQELECQLRLRRGGGGGGGVNVNLSEILRALKKG